MREAHATYPTCLSLCDSGDASRQLLLRGGIGALLSLLSQEGSEHADQRGSSRRTATGECVCPRSGGPSRLPLRVYRPVAGHRRALAVVCHWLARCIGSRMVATSCELCLARLCIAGCACCVRWPLGVMQCCKGGHGMRRCRHRAIAPDEPDVSARAAIVGTHVQADCLDAGGSSKIVSAAAQRRSCQCWSIVTGCSTMVMSALVAAHQRTVAHPQKARPKSIFRRAAGGDVRRLRGDGLLVRFLDGVLVGGLVVRRLRRLRRRLRC